jgi:hypothetical protein
MTDKQMCVLIWVPAWFRQFYQPAANRQILRVFDHVIPLNPPTASASSAGPHPASLTFAVQLLKMDRVAISHLDAIFVQLAHVGA